MISHSSRCPVSRPLVRRRSPHQRPSCALGPHHMLPFALHEELRTWVGGEIAAEVAQVVGAALAGTAAAVVDDVAAVQKVADAAAAVEVLAAWADGALLPRDDNLG